MTRQMTTYSPPRMPAPMSRDLSNTVAKFKNRLEEHPGPYRHFSICESSAPTDAERQVLHARRNELTEALQPGDPNAIAKEINLLKAGFSSYGVDAVSAQVQVRIYLEALSKFPLWAVQEARSRFQNGRNVTPWNNRDCPSSAQMAIECRAIISPVQDEITPLADVLDAETYAAPDPDFTNRLKAVLRWEKDIRPQMAAKDQPKKPQEAPEQALERLHGEASQPVAIGDGLSKFLSGMKRGRAA